MTQAWVQLAITASEAAPPTSALFTRRFEAQLRWQPVVKVWRRTETGEAPRGQGATTENTGST